MSSEGLSVYIRPKQEPGVLDEPDEVVPAPLFASELQLTVKELFAWLLG